MSAEVLREAATLIRKDWGESWQAEDPSAAFHLAVADWLEVTADDVGTSTLSFHAAIAVARAYAEGST